MLCAFSKALAALLLARTLGDNSWIVGNPYLIALRQSGPSSVRNRRQGSKSTFQFLTTGLRGDVKESRKYAGMNWLKHKVQCHGNSSVRYAPYLTWVLTANS